MGLLQKKNQVGWKFRWLETKLKLTGVYSDLLKAEKSKKKNSHFWKKLNFPYWAYFLIEIGLKSYHITWTR